MSGAQHTAAPWHVGAQNDALCVVSGRAPSLGNDTPHHEADRTAVAKVYDIRDAWLMASAPDGLALAKAYEAWEADLIMDAAAWRDGLPRLTPRHYDRLLELQAQRNAFIAKAEGRS